MPRRCAFSAKTPCAAPLTARLWSPPAGGVVTDEARQAFDRALAEQPGQPQARYYLALAAEQDGKKADAIRDYQSLLAEFAARRALAEHGERAARGAQGRARARDGRRRHSRGAAADDRGHGVETRRRGSPAMAAASTNGRALFAPIRCCMRPTRPRRRSPTRARRSRPTPTRSRASTRWRATSASETPIDPPRPPPFADRRSPRRRRRGGWPFALCAERQHRVLLQPVRSRPESGRAWRAAAHRRPGEDGLGRQVRRPERRLRPHRRRA